MRYLQVKSILHNWDRVKSTVSIANEMMGLKLADFCGVLKSKDLNKMEKMTAILKIISYFYTLTGRIDS